MALKFLNKKGWHTGSLRNIENVWKAEQKHEAEQKKLEELRKQIQEEKERSEFRRLQEQAGLVPRQERLEFLYDSGLSVGKSSSDGGFKALEALPQSTSNDMPASSSSGKQDSVPGALFEDKPHSANDTWRKLHSDPLLMIRQREQEAVARIKNNPVKMAMIRKSVESKKHEDDDGGHDRVKRKHRKHSKHRSDSEDDDTRGKVKRSKKEAKHKGSKYREYTDSDDDRGDERTRRRHRDLEREAELQKFRERSPEKGKHQRQTKSHDEMSKHEKSQAEDDRTVKAVSGGRYDSGSHHMRRYTAPKLTEEERAARLREMQRDAELHEEQRWKRLKKADENDAREAAQSVRSRGKTFLDAAQKSVYGAEGGSSTIEESVRRRSHYLQNRSAAEGNAFRR